jgi:acetolactate synthase-1/3 small subunit
LHHTVSILGENRFDILARMSTLFATREFNVDSLSVSESEDPGISKMTIVVKGDYSIIEQVIKQLNKLMDVIKINDFNDVEYVLKRDITYKDKYKKSTRNEISQSTEILRSRIIDVSQDSSMVEINGDGDKTRAFIKMVMPYGIKGTCKTGIVALGHG